VHCDWCRLL